MPLGDAYLELIAVVDEAEAEQSLIGRWVAGAHPELARPLGWAVRASDLDHVARRLGLTIHEGSRARPDGTVLRWRSAGYERAAVEPSFPFFIEWEQGSALPGQTPITHPGGSLHVERLELEGDADHLADWLGPHRLPIDVGPGSPAVKSVVLTGEAGRIIIGPEPL